MRKIIVALFSMSVLTSIACSAASTAPLGYNYTTTKPAEETTAKPAKQYIPLNEAVIKEAIKNADTIKAHVPDTDHADAALTEETFTVMAGDVLQITVWKEESLDKEVVVLQDDTITFPLIGTVKVSGLSPTDLEKAIKQKLAKFIPDATVSVLVKAPLGHTVSIIGQVSKPGEIVMSRPMGVMEALSQVGGLTPYADTSHIVILRNIDGKKSSIKFPYDAVAEGRKLENDINLKAKDVVVVPTGGLF